MPTTTPTRMQQPVARWCLLIAALLTGLPALAFLAGLLESEKLLAALLTAATYATCALVFKEASTRVRGGAPSARVLPEPTAAASPQEAAERAEAMKTLALLGSVIVLGVAGFVASALLGSSLLASFTGGVVAVSLAVIVLVKG